MQFCGGEAQIAANRRESRTFGALSQRTSKTTLASISDMHAGLQREANHCASRQRQIFVVLALILLQRQATTGEYSCQTVLAVVLPHLPCEIFSVVFFSVYVSLKTVTSLNEESRLLTFRFASAIQSSIWGQ